MPKNAYAKILTLTEDKGYLLEKGEPREFDIEGQPEAVILITHNGPGEKVWGAVYVDTVNRSEEAELVNFDMNIRTILRDPDMYQGSKVDLAFTWTKNDDDELHECIKKKAIRVIRHMDIYIGEINETKTATGERV